MANPGKFNYRDISTVLQKLRNFLMGRKHTLHGRFPPKLSSRTIPPPDVPRGPEYKYSKQYYFERNATGLVKPPVVAPIAEGLQGNSSMRSNGKKSDAVCFSSVPTPGQPYWWDGHFFYEQKPDKSPPSPCSNQSSTQDKV